MYQDPIGALVQIVNSIHFYYHSLRFSQAAPYLTLALTDLPLKFSSIQSMKCLAWCSIFSAMLQEVKFLSYSTWVAVAFMPGFPLPASALSCSFPLLNKNGTGITIRFLFVSKCLRIRNCFPFYQEHRLNSLSGLCSHWNFSQGLTVLHLPAMMGLGCVSLCLPNN